MASARAAVRIGRVSAFRLFVALMALSFLSAFVLPPRYTTPVRTQVQGLFSPVSRPTRAIAGALYRRANPDRPTDDGSPQQPRETAVVLAENHELRAQLAALEVKFDELSRLNADRQMVGDIFSLCRPATVTGVDSSGVRETLKITGVGSNAAGRPVIHGHDLVGRVQAAGLTGAEVRLLTDPGFGFTAKFARYVPDGAGRLRLEIVEPLHPLVQGIGHGSMAIRSTVTMQQVADLHLAVGDLVVLQDREGKDWPDNVQGLCAGRVASIASQANAPIFADIRVEPTTDLLRLNEVMVVVKD
jgi:cell shape-determining protein MreC